jgi:hypothetical protein
VKTDMLCAMRKSVVALGFTLFVFACEGATPPPETPKLAGGQESVAPVASSTAAATPAARSRDAYAAALNEVNGKPLQEIPESTRQRIDALGGARDSAVTGLYWYTDLEAAKAEAKKTGKPIVSLRMLGKLTDELSCANSRFFRTALYPNKAVRDMLASQFILHWSSERPVPVVTIDLGDGKVAKRTLTGNSIHYVLTPDGEVADGIPGLYSPQAFVKALAKAHELALLKSDERKAAHATSTETASQEARALLGNTRVALPVSMFVPGGNTVVAKPRNLPGAQVAVPIAMGKAAYEGPMLGRTMPMQTAPSVGDGSGRGGGSGRISAAPEVWATLARAQSPDRLDDSAANNMYRKWLGAERADSADAKESFASVRRAFEARAAEDTVRNELERHTMIHSWLSAEQLSFEAINTRVYDDLFLTPKSDPWLGLLPPAVYTGLEGDGGRALAAYPKEAFTVPVAQVEGPAVLPQVLPGTNPREYMQQGRAVPPAAKAAVKHDSGF